MIYFDNAATTFPKPPQVGQAVAEAFTLYGANPGRSGHDLSLRTAGQVYGVREAAAEFFGAAGPEQVVFTQNCTHALNLVIHGLLRQGDHVVISDLEHNSVLRPVHTLAQQGVITYSVARTSREDGETVEAFRRCLAPNTRLILCTHGSNLVGWRLPIGALAELAAGAGVLFGVDAAQTAGVEPLDMGEMGIDFLCTAGHKGLYGPAGTGLLVTRRGGLLRPLLQGGTGSLSADYNQPELLPDRLEAGTVNTPGILGLGAGLRFLKEQGMEAVARRERAVADVLYAGLARIPRVRLLPRGALPVVSFNLEGLHSEETARLLNRAGFALRGGLHCAPLAHQKFGTLETGAVRASVGAFNTPEEARLLVQAVEKAAQTP